MRRTRGSVVLGLAVGAFLVLTMARAEAAPWDKLLTFASVEADPDTAYWLTEEQGPWMVLACSFSGQNARQEAHELVLELRRRYKLPAYLYEKNFDLGEETYGRGIDRYGAPLRMKYQRGSEVTEVAVMVGNFEAVDDRESQRTLEQIKHTFPQCLELDPSHPTNRNFAAWRLLARFASPEAEKKGPMAKAFITTNPLLPKDYFAPKGIDKLVLAMNEGNKYSLLDCPGKFTVQVAHFTGGVLIKQDLIRAENEGRGRMKSKLDEAGEKAEKLVEALRMKGYEAYVLHDRYASIVTVGSFDSVGTPRRDGRIEINPKIHAIMKTFGADQPAVGAGQPSMGGFPGGTSRPKAVVGVPLDVQPIPVEVPKRSIASDYASGVARMP